MLFDTPDMSKTIPSLINNGLWLRTHAVKNGIPVDCWRAYQVLLNNGVGHFKTIIDHIIQSGGNTIQVPMQPESIEKYLSGFTFEYRPFCNLYEYTRQTEGFWRIDPERPTHVIIFYNRCTSPERQRFTKVHELFHFLQTVDRAFLDFLDELILNSTLPEHVVIKILERSTDKAAVMFLMPNHFFVKKYEEIEIYSEGFGEAELRKLAAAFQVSIESARYRLQECVYQPQQVSI
jgi:hypothetical protein